LKTIVIDSGVAFDPTAKEKADTSLSAEDRQIGGLGILLVRELMDAINYERNNGKNVLTLIKKYLIKRIMNTKIEEIDGKYIATLEGEMDTAAAVEVEEVLKPLYQSNGKDVIIDCKNLEYIASSGLRILLSILKGAKASGSKVVLRGVNDDIKNVFKLTGFISIFEFE